MGVCDVLLRSLIYEEKKVVSFMSLWYIALHDDSYPHLIIV